MFQDVSEACGLTHLPRRRVSDAKHACKINFL